MVATTLPGLGSALTSRGYTLEQEILQTRIPQEVILVTYIYIYLYVYQVYEKVNVRMWHRILYVFYRIPQKAYKICVSLSSITWFCPRKGNPIHHISHDFHHFLNRMEKGNGVCHPFLAEDDIVGYVPFKFIYIYIYTCQNHPHLVLLMLYCISVYICIP